MPHPKDETQEAKPPSDQEVDKMIKDLGAIAGDEEAEEQMAEDAPPEEAPGDEGPNDGDLAPLIETLGVTPERAAMLMDAAQQLEKTQGKSPQELADMIANDFDVLMQLEMVAAQTQAAPIEPPPAAPEAAIEEAGMMSAEGM